MKRFGDPGADFQTFGDNKTGFGVQILIFLVLYGRVESSWTVDNDVFQLTVTVPPNSEAFVHLPGRAVENIIEQGKPLAKAEGISEIWHEDETTILSISSGHYCFVIKKQ